MEEFVMLGMNVSFDDSTVVCVGEISCGKISARYLFTTSYMECKGGNVEPSEWWW